MNEIISQILATLFIAFGIIYYQSKIADVLDEKQFMIKTLFLILFMLVLLLIADELFFGDRQLLSMETRASLFSLIEKLLLIMFGFYFGQKHK